MCGGTLRNETGIISPPDKDGDGTYDPHLDCLWTIVAPEDKIIEISVQDLDFPEVNDCEIDFLEVRITIDYTHFYPFLISWHPI